MSVILRREQEERSCLSHVMCFSHSLIPIPLMSIPLIIILLNSHFFPQLIRVPIGIEDCRAPIMILDLQPQALCTGLYRHSPYLLRQGGRLRINSIQFNSVAARVDLLPLIPHYEFFGDAWRRYWYGS